MKRTNKKKHIKNTKKSVNGVQKPSPAIIDDQIVCASRNSTIHLLEILKGDHEHFDIICENEYCLEIFKAKLAYIQYYNKLNIVCKKEYIKRRYKNNNIVLMHIKDPLNFKERIEEQEKKKEMFKLNKGKVLVEDEEEEKENTKVGSRKYLIYQREINVQLLNSEIKIKYINNALNYYAEYKFINLEFEKEVSFYEKLEQNINKQNMKEEVIKNKEEEIICLENDILDKRIPVYLINPTLNMYFPILIELLNKLKTYKMKILIITSNPNKLVELLNSNKINSKQYQTTSYNVNYEKETLKTENTIYISNVRHFFEKFDFIIEFLLNDFTKLTETLNKKVSSKKFLNGNENQKNFKFDLKKIGNLKIKNLHEMIFERGIIIFPIFTDFNKKFLTISYKNNNKLYGEEFDIKNFIKK